MTAMDRGFTISNGIGWSPDDRTMYFTDTPSRPHLPLRLRRRDRRNREPARVRRSRRRSRRPDGMTVDAEGFVWSAQFDRWCIHRYAPDGRLDRAIRMPVQRPTTCMFGGPDLATLYVTSARMDLADDALAAQPQAGGVFALDVGVRGLPGRGSPGEQGSRRARRGRRRRARRATASCPIRRLRPRRLGAEGMRSTTRPRVRGYRRPHHQPHPRLSALLRDHRHQPALHHDHAGPGPLLGHRIETAVAADRAPARGRRSRWSTATMAAPPATATAAPATRYGSGGAGLWFPYGMTSPGAFHALMMRRHMDLYGTTADHLGADLDDVPQARARSIRRRHAQAVHDRRLSRPRASSASRCACSTTA